MFGYLVDLSNQDLFVRIDKDYDLQIEKNNGEIIIEKVKRKELYSNEYCSNYSLDTCLKTEDINKQLANVKHIGFEVTEACNLKCTYCVYGEFYTDYNERKDKSADIIKAKLLIDFLIGKVNSSANKSLLNRIIISFYGGEPLLNMSFIKEIVLYSQERQNNHIVFDYVITTNAIYLKKYISFFVEYNFTITVSLDGAKDNDAYRKFANGKSSFEIVYKNLEYIYKEYSNYFKEKIRFNSVMHNLNNVQDVFSFFYSNFGKIPRFSELNPFGVKLSKKKDFEDIICEKPYVKNENIYNEIKKELDLNFGELNQLQHFVFHYSGNTYYDYNDLLISIKKKDHLPTGTCIPFSKRIFMTVNNKILPCEKIGQQYSLGEVTDKGVDLDFDNIVDKYNRYYTSLSAKCNICYFKRHCTQCMFDIQGLDENPICDKFANKIVFEKYLKVNMNLLLKNYHLYKRIITEVIIVK